MKTKMAIISLLLGASSAWATLITDNFDRADTTRTTYTVNVGGSGWTQSGDGVNPASDWWISGNTARGRARASDAVMYNTDLSTVSGGGDSFTLSTDVMTLNGGYWNGVAFNYTDADNMYFIRFKSDTGEYQLIERNDGVQTTHVNTTLSSGTFAQDVSYTITVASDAAGKFNYSILNGATVVVSGSVDDSANAVTGGYAGLYTTGLDNAAQGVYDNFSLEVIPEPATLGLFSVAFGLILVIRKIRD